MISSSSPRSLVAIRTFVVLVSAALVAQSLAAAENFVFIPARGLPAEPARLVLTDILRFALEKAEPGSRIYVIDPIDHRLQSSFTIPAGTLRQRANDPAVRSGVTSMKAAFLDNPPRSPWQRAALCLPETLHFLRAQVIRPGDQAVVVFLGNPLHQAADDAFVFRNGVTPTDGWLFSAAEDSPFAVTSATELTGWRVHVAAIPSAWGQSDWQRTEVQRFWAAFCDLSGAKLVTLADPKLALHRVADNAGDALAYRPVDRESRSRLFRKRIFVRGQETETVIKSATETVVSSDLAATEVAPLPVQVASLPAEVPATPLPVAAPAAPAEPTPAVIPVPSPAPVISQLARQADATLPKVGPGKMGLGVLWETTDGRRPKNIDLDLRVRVRGINAECNFRNTVVADRDGPVMRLYEDIRSAKGIDASGAARQDFEFVEIGRSVSPADVSVHINVYANRSGAPLRVLFRVETANGSTFSRIISLPGTTGDNGAGSERRASSPDWHEVNLAQLIENGS